MSLFETLHVLIFKNKLITFLGLLCFIFFVSTIALSVEKNNLAAELEKYYEHSTTVKPITNVTQTTNSGTTTVTPTSTTAEGDPDYSYWRLQKNFIKLSEYVLKLYLNLEEGTYAGELDIKFIALEKFNRLQIHSAKNLYDSAKNYTIKLDNYAIDSSTYIDTDIIHLYFGYRDKDIGNHVLSFKFNGKLNDKLVGFYRSSYNENNETR